MIALSRSSFAPGRIHAHDPKLPCIKCGFFQNLPFGLAEGVHEAWYPTASANSATARLRASLNARGPVLPQVLLEHQI